MFFFVRNCHSPLFKVIHCHNAGPFQAAPTGRLACRKTYNTSTLRQIPLTQFDPDIMKIHNFGSRSLTSSAPSENWFSVNTSQAIGNRRAISSQIHQARLTSLAQNRKVPWKCRLIFKKNNNKVFMFVKKKLSW